MVVGFVAAWVAKKTLVLVAANIYGVARLYRRSLELNDKVHGGFCCNTTHLRCPQLFSKQGALHGRTKHFLRHTFDFTVS